MGQNVILTGMVLQTMPIGEYDKRVTILTKERGRITAFAKGARRLNSSLLAASAPFVFGRFELYEGRSSYNLYKAEIDCYFRELTMDLDNTYYGFYFLEMADYFTQENMDEKEVLKLLYLTMKAIEKNVIPNRLIRRIFELKMLVINGIYPNVFSCQCCKKKEELTAFSVAKAGVVCASCQGGEQEIRLDESTLYTLQYIISTDLKKLYTFTVSDQVLERLEQILTRYLEKYVNHSFKSEKFLDNAFF
ncbi:MAG: DNA repair protein RecO [Lachnospiraceae bacterium]|nr:DNA repair protein RecO [Lachnospiraceae bacterium]